MENYANETEYLAALLERSGLPDGFSAGSVELAFKPAEIDAPEPVPMRLSAIVLDEPTDLFAGKLTRNLYPGAPVKVTRRRLSGPRLRGVLVNNKIANVCAEGGESDAEELLGCFASEIGGKPEDFIPASTGGIG
jgi:glutamate N-acetyltransferase/amino-acid N-acetyltransferase